MTLKYEIIKSSDEEKDIVLKRLQSFNRNILHFDPKLGHIPLNYIIKHNDQLIAGINASFYFHSVLHTDILFVEEGYRKLGLGIKLLTTIESEAKAMGATLAHLDTFDFQAKDFYLNHGYEVFGVLENCPEGHKRYYMSKML